MNGHDECLICGFRDPWSLDEKKLVVRAFVEGLTLYGSDRTGELRIRELPTSALQSTGSSSVEYVAGVGFEPTTFGL